MAALIPLFQALALSGISLYTQMHRESMSCNAAALASLVPLAGQVYDALSKIGNALKQAQDEGWAEDDERWKPYFEAADAALDAAEARLT
jgi:hypothetical protein